MGARCSPKRPAHRCFISIKVDAALHCGALPKSHFFSFFLQAVDDEALLKKLALDDSNLPQRCIHGTYRNGLA